MAPTPTPAGAGAGAGLGARLREVAGAGGRLVLGTGSRARREVMDEVVRELGLPAEAYEVLKADIDEKVIRRPDPAALVAALAAAKAEAITARHLADARAGLLITADQVVVHEGRILEKPETEAEFRAFVAGYAEAPPRTFSGVAVTNLATGRRHAGLDVVEIEFAPGGVPEDALARLVAEGEVFWCAGGIMVEHELVRPHIRAMSGPMDSVFGLPKQLLLQLLEAAVADDAAADEAGQAGR